MRASFLIVVACIDLGGSYYDQTSLSSVLSAFEARLTIPRSKEAEQGANESGLGSTTLTASAPVSTAVPTSAAATKMPAEFSTESTESAATVPNAALPSHFATNSGSSHTVGSVHTWTYKEVSLVAHVGQVLWLAVLTGMSFHFLGATAHLWHAVYDLRRARA